MLIFSGGGGGYCGGQWGGGGVWRIWVGYLKKILYARLGPLYLISSIAHYYIFKLETS